MDHTAHAVSRPRAYADRLAALESGAPSAVSLREGVALAQHHALATDARVMLLGESVGRLGGAFGSSEGLQARFGAERVIDLPISTAGAVGLAIGLGLAGKRPVVELGGALGPALGQLQQELAAPGAENPTPIVLRWVQDTPDAPVPVGVVSDVKHLQIALPSTPEDAQGLILGALKQDGAVLIIETVSVLGAEGQHSVTPLALGRAKVRREGQQVTVITAGAGVGAALAAAEASEVSIEVIDLVSLRPLDLPTVVASVSRTGRVLLAAEPGWGALAAEILHAVTQACFLHLESPPQTVAATASAIAEAASQSLHY
jgi:pyruvate/2-oxoglutarate/acetoin dehydrogenase E1 component